MPCCGNVVTTIRTTLDYDTQRPVTQQKLFLHTYSNVDSLWHLYPIKKCFLTSSSGTYATHTEKNIHPTVEPML